MLNQFITLASTTGIAGAWLWHSQGALLVAALLTLASVGLLVCRVVGLERVDASVRRLRNLAPSARAFGATLLALGLITTAAGAGAFGSGPQQVADDVDPVGDAAAFACGGVCVAVGVGVVVGASTGYLASEYLNGDKKSETYTQADALETKIAVHEHARTIDSGHNTTAAIMSNQVNDGSRTIAWIKGKTAVIHALNANKSVSTAKQWAKENVSDYYATMEINLLNQQTDTLRKIDYLNAQYLDHSSLSTSPFRSRYGRMKFNTTVETYTTLVNGSTHNMSTYEKHDTNYDNYFVVGIHPDQNLSAPKHNFDDNSYGEEHMWEVPPNSNYSKVNTTIEGVKFWNLYEDINTSNTQMRENLDHYADGVYTEYNAGELNISDIPDPTTLAQEFSTDYNSTGYYAYSSAELGLLGVNASVNHSMTINVNGTAGPTYNGSLYTNWEPSVTGGTWEVNQTYDPATTDYGVYIGTNDGLRLVNDTFVIESMTNVQTGTSVNNTTTEQYIRQTNNVTLTMEELQQLIEYRQDVEDAEAAAAGGGGGDWFGGFDLGNPTALVMLLAGAALLMASRD